MKYNINLILSLLTLEAHFFPHLAGMSFVQWNSSASNCPYQRTLWTTEYFIFCKLTTRWKYNAGLHNQQSWTNVSISIITIYTCSELLTIRKAYSSSLYILYKIIYIINKINFFSETRGFQYETTRSITLISNSYVFYDLNITLFRQSWHFYLEQVLTKTCWKYFRSIKRYSCKAVSEIWMTLINKSF